MKMPSAKNPKLLKFHSLNRAVGQHRRHSAKRRLMVVLPPMLTVPPRSSKASVMILSRNMLNRVEISMKVKKTAGKTSFTLRQFLAS